MMDPKTIDAKSPRLRSCAKKTIAMWVLSASGAIGLLPASTICTQAQSPKQGAAVVRFEVASVKQVLDWPPVNAGTGERGTGGGCPTRMNVDATRVDFRCTTVAMLIGYAFRISPERITGPDWMKAIGTSRFNVEATIPQGASKERVPEMFQALLAERFHLAVHHGTAMAPAYVLVTARGGIKLKQAVEQNAVTETPETAPAHDQDGFYGNIRSRILRNADGTEAGAVITSPRTGTVHQTGDPYQTLRWAAESISMAGLADLLDNVAPLSLPIIDGTGLNGRFQLTLEISLSDLPGAKRSLPADGESDRNAMVVRDFNQGLAKLGLRLEQRKAEIETIVVDHVEKTPTAN
jgi:uncharacterized protein (TIGR03435 family)